LMLSGNAAGAAAGQITYYAGTLSYLVGRLGPVEWALMAVGGALAALGLAFKAIDKEQQEHLKTLDDHIKKMRGYRHEIELIEQQILSGSTQQAMVDLAYADLQAAEYLEGAAKKRWDEQRARFKKTGEGLQQVLDARTAYQEAHRRAVEAEGAMEAAAIKRDAVTIARRDQLEKQKEKKEKERKDRQRREREADAEQASGGIGSIGWGITQKIEGFMGMVVPAGFGDEIIRQMGDTARADALRDRIFQQQEQAAERYLQMRWRAADEGMKIADRQARHEQKIDRARMVSIENSVALAGKLGELMADSEEGRATARIAASVAMSAVDAVREAALGWGALETPWIAAGHFTSAALHAVVAATDIAGAVRGVGSGGGGRGGGGLGGIGGGGVYAGSGGSERTEKEEGAKYIIYVNGHMINTSPDFNRVFAEGSDAWRDSQNPGASKDKF